MKITKKTFFLTAVLVITIVLVWLLFFNKKSKAINLTIEVPSFGYIAESVTATGTIQPLDTVSVGTQVSGTISVLNADFNSEVKAGQLLAQLDKTLLQAEVDAQAANVGIQKSQLTFNQNNFDRQSKLYATGSISKLEFESAQNTFLASQAALEGAKAQLRGASKNLSFADIYSPINGVILSRNISLGQTVAASFNTPTLFVIAKDITKMQVQAAIDEADIGQVSKGQRASFTVDAFIDEAFKGIVVEVRLHPKVLANVVSFTTIINAPNDAMKLKPGMTANIVVYTREIDNALRIRSKALNFTPDSLLQKTYSLNPLQKTLVKQAVREGRSKRAYVWVKSGSILHQRAIQIGIDDNNFVEVISGLSPRDSVVIGLPLDLTGKSGASANDAVSAKK